MAMKNDLAAWYEECVFSYMFLRRPRWTRAQKAKAVELKLKRTPHKSDRVLAAETGFSREFIKRVRDRLEGWGQIPRGTRIGSDGKRYRMPAVKAGGGA